MPRRAEFLHRASTILLSLKLDHRAARQRDVVCDVDRAAFREMKRGVLLVIVIFARRAIDRNDDLVAALRGFLRVPTAAPWNEFPQMITVLMPACLSTGSSVEPTNLSGPP